MLKSRLKKGDLVMVISGSYKGKTGKIMAHRGEKIFVEGIHFVSRHLKSENPENKKPNITQKHMPISVSNVMFYSKSQKAERIGFLIKEGKKIRVTKKTREELN